MSADISKLREIVGSHLAKWRATTPLEDFANVDDVYRTLMPELEEFFAAHTNAEIAKVLDTIESAVLGEVTDEEERYEVYTAIQAERAKLKEVK